MFLLWLYHCGKLSDVRQTRTDKGGKLQRNLRFPKKEFAAIWQWKSPEIKCRAAVQINTELTRIFPHFLHVWLTLPFKSVCYFIWSGGYINKSFLLGCLIVFCWVAQPDVLFCLDYRYLYNHCPGPEWNVMCRGCCEYDVIRCKCPLQGTPVGYAVPCCRNAINECDPCIIHPGRTSAGSLFRFELGPDQYIDLLILLTDIGLSQIYRFWHICSLVSADNKTVI